MAALSGVSSSAAVCSGGIDTTHASFDTYLESGAAAMGEAEASSNPSTGELVFTCVDSQHGAAASANGAEAVAAMEGAPLKLARDFERS